MKKGNIFKVIKHCVCIISVILLACPPALAEDFVFGPNIRVDDTGSDTSTQRYVSMDVAANGDIYAVWQDGRDVDSNIYFAKSTDRGAIFDANVRVDDTGSLISSQDAPVVAASANDDICVVWNDKRNGNWDIYFAKSTDNGATFGSDVRVDDTGTGTSLQVDAVITTDQDNNIYVVWADYRNGDADIYFAKSADNGSTFSANVQVDDGSSGDKVKPAIVVDASGNIYIAWKDYYSGFGEIVFAKSADGGATFGANVLVNDPWSVNHSSPSIAVDNTSGNIYITWNDDRLSIHHIWFSRSTNGGASFEEDLRVDDSTSGGQYAPAITISPEGDIYIVWNDFRNSGVSHSDIYFSRSTDSGLNFESNLRVDDTGTANVEQRYPSMATDVDGQVYVVWHDDRNANLNYDIYFARSFYKPDLDRNDRVDFLDFDAFAVQWLNDCSGPNWCGGADFDESSVVDFNDLALTCKYWLTGTE